MDALDPAKPADQALLAILAAVAFSDGEVDDTEVALLARVLPGRDPAALRAWAVQAGGRALNFDGIARALPSSDERWRALRFAVRMAWKDGEIESGERALLESLISALELPEGALETALSDINGRGTTTVDPAKIVDAFKHLQWDAVDWSEGGLSGPLAAYVPKGSTPVLRIGVDGHEVLGLCKEGLVGEFREGAAWLPWTDIVTFTRFSTFGTAVQLHTEEGKRYSLLDFRLSGMGQLLDRLYSNSPRKVSAPPVITQTRGE